MHPASEENGCENVAQTFFEVAESWQHQLPLSPLPQERALLNARVRPRRTQDDLDEQESSDADVGVRRHLVGRALDRPAEEEELRGASRRGSKRRRTSDSIELVADAKLRGSYKCSKCGQPKKGHVCHIQDDPPARLSHPVDVLQEPASLAALQVHLAGSKQVSETVLRHPSLKTPPQKSQQIEAARWPGSPEDVSGEVCTPSTRAGHTTAWRYSLDKKMGREGRALSPSSSCSSNERYERALAAVRGGQDEDSSDQEDDEIASSSMTVGGGMHGLPESCLLHILSRLPPRGLLVAGTVCHRWRRSSQKVWAAVQEASLFVQGNSKSSPDKDHDRSPLSNSGAHIPHVLRHCPDLRKLTLVVVSALGDDVLHGVATACPRLASLEIRMAGAAMNSVSGQGLSVLVDRCQSLEALKVEGCSSITSLVLKGRRLATFWMSGCSQLQFLALECPYLSELSLDFTPPRGRPDPGPLNPAAREAAATASVTLFRHAVSTCPNLERLHISSRLLNDTAVMAMLSNNLRRLTALSLTHGRGITNESAAQIVSRCRDLELLDLSGSHIMDSALEVIANTFSSTLRHLLVALCPNLTVAGIQTAASLLPCLELLDCGYSLVSKDPPRPIFQRPFSSGGNEKPAPGARQALRPVLQTPANSAGRGVGPLRGAVTPGVAATLGRGGVKGPPPAGAPRNLARGPVMRTGAVTGPALAGMARGPVTGPTPPGMARGPVAAPRGAVTGPRGAVRGPPGPGGAGSNQGRGVPGRGPASFGVFDGVVPQQRGPPKSFRLALSNQLLRKVSLWGCSGLQGIELLCPHLGELNISGCVGLRPGDVVLRCPQLQHVHSRECNKIVVAAVRDQVELGFALSDGEGSPSRADTKRILAPRRLVSEEGAQGPSCKIHL